MNQILVYQSKYGETYWDASTNDKLEKSARIILGELLSTGWIPEPEDPMKHIEYANIDVELAQLDEDTIAALPTVSLRDEAWSHKKKLEKRISRYDRDVARYAEMQAVAAGEERYNPDWVQQADSRDGKRKAGDTVKGSRITAWSILLNYQDEYVSFELESVTDPDGY